MGVKTESGSGFGSPSDGAVNTLEVKIAPSSEFGSSNGKSGFMKELDSDALSSDDVFTLTKEVDVSSLSGLTTELDSGVLLSGIAVGKSGFTTELGSGVLLSGIGKSGFTKELGSGVGKSGFTKELGLGVLSIGEDNITALAADVESLCADS